MAKIYYDKDADLGALKGKTVAVIGYGSQGSAQSQNLRDSGVNVVVGLRPGKSWDQAVKDGMAVKGIAEAVKSSHIIQILAPDQAQAELYRKEIQPYLKAGQALGFSHGFNIHFSQIVPPPDIDVIMVAPKGPGKLVRRVYQEGFGVPCLVAVYQDASGKAMDLALAYAKGVGGTRAGVLETTFAEETETDLFGEQAVLCGGTSALIQAGFETLVEAGYQPEVAYFECLHELKLIVDLIYEKGITGMREVISDTAKYGDLTRGKWIINEDTRETMREILDNIQSGQFATEWILENQANRATFNALMRKEAAHPVEVVGKKLRSMMSWLKKD